MNMADRWRESVGVVALDSAHEAAAREWARRLDLPLGDNHRHLLQFGAEGLQLLVVEPGAPGPTRVDFVHGAAAHRRQFGGGKGQMIARAIGIAPGVRPIVLDATAGLGRDAFVLATLGCAVTLIERHPLVAALLEDGLRRARGDENTAPIAARMHLCTGDALELMSGWSLEVPQVVYLDPMFPHREKSGLVKKEMRALRPLVGDDDDASALLDAARRLASHRVVVKRPRHAEALGGVAPAHMLEGASSRFDIYPKQALKKTA